MLHRKTCKLPVSCVPVSLEWAAASPFPLCRERGGPSPTSTTGNWRFFPIPASNNTQNKNNVNYKQQ